MLGIRYYLSLPRYSGSRRFARPSVKTGEGCGCSDPSVVNLDSLVRYGVVPCEVGLPLGLMALGWSHVSREGVVQESTVGVAVN